MGQCFLHLWLPEDVASRLTEAALLIGFVLRYPWQLFRRPNTQHVSCPKFSA